MFTDDIAEKIIGDFIKDKTHFEDLVVHCDAGVSRSPAVGIALATIFDLDDPERLKGAHPYHNRYIRDRLLSMSKAILQ